MSRYIDADELLERIDAKFFETDPTGEEQIGILKCRGLVREAPTINSEDLYGGRRVLFLDDVYKVIAGHSDYHGNNILTALTCIAEGKEVKPVKPLVDLRPKGKPIKYHVPQGESIRIGMARFKAGTTVYRCPVCKTFIRPWQKFCDECGAKMEG